MADIEEPQYTTLAERIAALNKNKTFAANGPSSPKPVKPARPPPPSRTQPQPDPGTISAAKPATPLLPARPPRSIAPPPPLPRRNTPSSVNGQEAPRPPLPSRQSSAQPPLLPQHRDSRKSSSLESSQCSSKPTGQSSQSAASQAPVTAASGNTTTHQTRESEKHAATPRLPPRLPSRSSTQEVALAKPRIMGFSSSQAPKSSINGHNSSDEPPPVPTNSRPSAAQIDAVASRKVTTITDLSSCFSCRDWSAPDAIAAQYPRQSVPRNDPVGYLAHHLCSPFPSYDYKARAIFTWCHHNIAYDVGAFFGKNVQHATGESTILSGLAVCAGYAETYKAIANRAGLECEVVGGHGKGFGYTPLKDGERPPPPDPSGHAWNAVRIDGGAWKLVDACWGAGNVDGASQSFNKVFNPAQFTLPNEQFGARHFPQNPKYQFRSDGCILTWEQYYRGRADGEPVLIFSNASEEGISDDSVEPANKNISVYSGDTVRFQFCKTCPHWKAEKHGLGKAPLFVLKINGRDGGKEDMIPIETNGYWHWLDVNARDLGAPGQNVTVWQITSVDDKDARGLTTSDFLAAKGRKGMAFSFLMQWTLK